MVQQWWLRRDAISPAEHRQRFLDDYLYEKAVNELYAEFPVCAGQLVPAKQTASTPKPVEAKK